MLQEIMGHSAQRLARTLGMQMNMRNTHGRTQKTPEQTTYYRASDKSEQKACQKQGKP